MKTISISFLLLVAFPFHLMAQDSKHTTHHHSKTAPKYFTYTPSIDSDANHIVAPTNQSNRKTASANVALQKFQLPTQPNPLKIDEKLSSTPSRYKFQTPAPRVARLQVEEIIQEAVVQPPNVSPSEFQLPDNVVRPTPGNTAPSSPTVIESAPIDLLPPPEPVTQPQPVTQSQPVEQRYEENFRTDAPPVEPERVSLDELRMIQQGNRFQERPNTMRDVVDHFSPGGEPFAYRGYVGNPQFFGVDRRQCCDEWENMCNCGGLKSTPGHLGIPCLRSKDSCDTVTPCRLCKHKRRGCGCAACSK